MKTIKPKTLKRSAAIVLRISPEQKKAIDDYAHSRGGTVTGLIRVALLSEYNLII